MAEQQIQKKEKIQEISPQIEIPKFPSPNKIVFTKEIAELSNEFAKAYEVNDERETKYALIFNRAYPIDFEKVNSFKRIENESISTIFEMGKLLTPSGEESFACILRRPSGKKISQILTERKGGFDESFVTGYIFEQLYLALSLLHKEGIMHGSINPENVYYNSVTGRIYLKENISEFPGFSQKPVFETFERIICHKAGKDGLSYSADYYACGVFIISLIFGHTPLETFPDDIVANIKLENGSFESIYTMMKVERNFSFSPFSENLIRGLLNDRTRDRWGEEEIRKWFRKELVQSSISKIHKQTSTGFLFNDIEYYNPKFLTHAIQQNWDFARKYLKVTELTRWANIGLKDPEIETKLHTITSARFNEVILPDERLSLLIHILDNEGTIRFKDVSVSIYGFGNYIAYLYISQDREKLQHLAQMVDFGLIDSWIRQQKFPDDYKATKLGWSPRKVKMYIRKNLIGFGLERCLYEFNPNIACQSNILKHKYAVSLKDILNGLNDISSGFQESDPIDRHIAAFINRDLEIEDSIKIKPLQNFPHIGKDTNVINTVMLALAQTKSGIVGLNNLSKWLRIKLNAVLEKMNSKVIKKNMQNALDKAADSGDINALYSVIADPSLVRKDIYGFQEAKKQYKMLVYEITKMQAQSNLDKMAYRIGLKISVMVSYLICAACVMVVMFMNFK
jgi:serine/threonine protein kinase